MRLASAALAPGLELQDVGQHMGHRGIQRRRDLLVDLGVDAKRIQVVGYGVDFPVAENASARGRAQNRRVEIVFSDERGQLGAER